MSVDFGAIIKRSFQIAWNYKSLWVFGLFTSSAGGSFNFRSTAGKFLRVDLPQNTDWLPFHFDKAVILGLFLWVLFFVLLWFLCSLIAKPAMIDGVNKIARGGQYRFSESFSRGLDFFLRFLGISILGLVVAIAVVAVIVFGAILYPLTLILTIPAALIVGFLLFHIFSLGQVAMVARDSAIFDALGEGFDLLRKNLGNCVLMSLIYIGIAIVIAIIIGLVGLVTFLPINFLLAQFTGNLVSLLILGLFVGLPVSLVVGGYTGTFFNSMYIQFYFSLYEPISPANIGGPEAGPVS